MLTLGLVVVYSMGNLGVYRIYRQKYRGEFNWLLHGIIPLASSAALYLCRLQVDSGLNIWNPTNYTDWTFWVAAGWLVIGLALLGALALWARRDGC